MSSLRLALLVVLLTSVGCAPATQHVLVVLDQSLYETLTGVFQLEQTALCGKPDCYEVQPQGGTLLATPVPGWSLEKSRAFNRALLPAVEAGRQFNAVLAAWQPSTPLPPQVHTLIQAIATALLQVTADFPDGTTKTQILAKVSRAQTIILQVVDMILSVRLSTQTAKPAAKPFDPRLMR